MRGDDAPGSRDWSAEELVIVHVRSTERLAAVHDLLERGASSVRGDLADPDQTRAFAEQVRGLGRWTP